jgi:curli biogenesis system outer membrane secretion channel CsgG
MKAKMMLAITAIVAAAAFTTAAFTVPQEVKAYKHNHHNNHNDIKVDQQINQANICDNESA